MSKVIVKKDFWNGWKPVVVMGPVIVGLHWMWFKLQQNEQLVPKEEQLTEQPIITVSTQFSVFSPEFYFEIIYFFYVVLFSGWKENEKFCIGKAFIQRARDKWRKKCLILASFFVIETLSNQ